MKKKIKFKEIKKMSIFILILVILWVFASIFYAFCGREIDIDIEQQIDDRRMYEEYRFKVYVLFSFSLIVIYISYWMVVSFK